MGFMKQTFFAGLLICIFFTITWGQDTASEKYLSWSASQAESVAKQMRESSTIGHLLGNLFDLRGIHTDRPLNYKLRATWLTPEVIRAAARLEQLKNRLTDQQTRELVAEAESVGDTVFLVEIDPRKGSGVVPLDWRAFLQPKDLKPGSAGAVAGIKSPQLRNVPALNGVNRRNYRYDIFWVAFPLVDSNKRPLFSADLAEIQLVVGIYGSEGRISWKLPASIGEKIRKLSKN